MGGFTLPHASDSSSCRVCQTGEPDHPGILQFDKLLPAGPGPGRKRSTIVEGKMNEIHQGDCLEVLKSLPDQSVHCCVTSPPYFNLRNYGVSGQIGLEETPDEYVSKLIEVFQEVKRVLRSDGTLWLNLGDSYSNGGKKTRDIDDKLDECEMQTRPDDRYKPKDLLGIPWHVAFALQADGWYLRSDIIWHKINGMPSSVKDRPVSSHEHIFLLAKTESYYYDWEIIATSPTEFTMADKRPKGVIRQRVNLKSKYHDCDIKIAQQFRKQDSVGRSDYTGFNSRYTPVDRVRRKGCLESY